MTLYEALAVLELTIPVSHDDIRKAFRNKAKLFHPDKYTDPLLQESASRRFIAAKRASEFLLSFPAEQINTGRVHTRREPRVQTRRRPPAPPPPVVHSPLVKEFDNIARLVGLGSRPGKSFFRRRFSFSPVEWLGKGYMLLVEKVYPGEQRMTGLSYAVFRFFRLLFATLCLILVFFTLSVAGMLVTVIIFPPLLAFWIFYQVYRGLISISTGITEMENKPGPLPEWGQAPLRYLMARTLPLIAALLVMQLLLLFSLEESAYLFALCVVLTLAFLLLGISVVYEWLVFFRMKEEK